MKVTLLPWEKAPGRYNPNLGRIPYSTRGYYPNPTMGKILLCEQKVSFTPDRPPQPIIADVNRNTIPSGSPIIDASTVMAIYRKSADEEMSLMRATVDLLGEREFSPAWVEKAYAAPAHVAHPAYKSPDAPTGPPQEESQASTMEAMSVVAEPSEPVKVPRRKTKSHGD